MSDLPPGWEWTTIGDVAATSLGKMLDKKQATGLHPTPYLRNVNVRWGSFDLSDIAEMDIPPEKLDRVLARPGDVIACEGGEPGRAAVWRGPGSIALQKALHRIRPTVAITPDYLALLLQHLAMSRKLDPLFTGTTIKHLPQEKLRRVGVPLAPRPEQERIVAAIDEHLSRLDAADRSLASAVDRLGQMVATAKQEIITDAPPARLAELAFESRYGTSVKCDYVSAGLGVVRIPNIVDERIDTGDLKYATETDLPSKIVLRDGDVLIVRTNGSRNLIGQAAVASGQAVGLGFASYLIRYRLRDGVDPRYIAAAMSAPSIRRALEDLAATTAGQYNLSITRLDSVVVPLPSLDEQRRLVNVRSDILASIRRLADSFRVAQRRSASLRRAILAAAFSGQLVPQDPDDEPVSVMLERIQPKRAAAAPHRRTRRTRSS